MVTHPPGLMQSVFLPRTSPSPDEQHINFTMMDNPIIDLLVSGEAQKACSLMWTIYTRLRRADWQYFERPGVLLIHGDGQHTAWEILCELAGVASATLNKAIQWMKQRRVIGYWAGKNNAGIRIFFNIARDSLRPKKQQKNLHLVPTSFGSADTSPNEAPSKDSYAVQNNQDLERRALRDQPALPLPSDENAAPVAHTKPTLQLVPPVASEPSAELRLALLDAIVRKVEALERTVQDAMRQMPDADWLENAAIPKAVRVALAEVLRHQHGRGKPKDNTYVGAAQQTMALPPPTPIEHSLAYRATLESLRTLISPQAIECWFEPLNLLTRADGKRRLVAPDAVFREWILTNYADVMRDVGLTDCEWELASEEIK